MMKMTKLTKTLLVAGVALTVGTTPFIGGYSASAQTVISETAYEKIISFTKEDVNKATGIQLTQGTVNKVYNSLSQAASWEKLGYSKADAKRVADRFAQSNYQAVGILTDMVNNAGVSLKVVTINKPYYSTVNIGTTGEVANPGTNEPSIEEPNQGNNNQSVLSKQVKEIDVEIEYQHKDIEFEYDVKSNGSVKAEFENEFTGVKQKGTAAQQTIENLFEGLNVKNSSKTQIKNHILTKLGAAQNFKKFDFKVKFADGSKVDFKIK
ncbi:hypothetical protein GIX45_25860 [Erwinia sp. CPCC 100877]|nr:hypothetical protein [Erwinia sp. CPCC 100877]